MVGVGYRTHPLLPRLGDVFVGLEQSANVKGLSAPEIAVDAPVEGELERPPVEAPTHWSQSLRAAGARGGWAHKTCTRELIATCFDGVAAAA